MAKVKYKLKAIMLDIDNTLIDTSRFVSIARDAAVDALILGGLTVERDVITKNLRRIIEEYGSNYGGHFDILLEELKVPKEKRNKLITYATISYHNAKQVLHPFPDVPSTLMKLKKEKYNLYAVSEGLSRKQWEKLIRSNLDRIIDDVFMTEDLSFTSKEPKFYNTILEKLGLKAFDCVMVGDRMDKDIIPAKITGMNTLHVLTRGYNKKNKSQKEDKIFSINSISELIDAIPKIEEAVSKEHYH